MVIVMSNNSSNLSLLILVAGAGLVSAAFWSRIFTPEQSRPEPIEHVETPLTVAEERAIADSQVAKLEAEKKRLQQEMQDPEKADIGLYYKSVLIGISALQDVLNSKQGIGMILGEHSPRRLPEAIDNVIRNLQAGIITAGPREYIGEIPINNDFRITIDHDYNGPTGTYEIQTLMPKTQGNGGFADPAIEANLEKSL